MASASCPHGGKAQLHGCLILLSAHVQNSGVLRGGNDADVGHVVGEAGGTEEAGGGVNKETIGLLEKNLVTASSGSVAGSVASVGASVGSSVGASVGASVTGSVDGSVAGGFFLLAAGEQPQHQEQSQSQREKLLSCFQFWLSLNFFFGEIP